MNNLIVLKYYDKKKFPPGKWASEPDYCKWEHNDFVCVALRDMSLGIWKGFVGLTANHPCHNKSIDDILKAPGMLDAFLAIHGGICFAGHLPAKYEVDAKKYWWVGFETSHGGDLYPLLKTTPDMDILLSRQTYKDLIFVRKETNKLSKYLSRIK